MRNIPKGLPGNLLPLRSVQVDLLNKEYTAIIKYDDKKKTYHPLVIHKSSQDVTAFTTYPIQKLKEANVVLTLMKEDTLSTLDKGLSPNIVLFPSNFK